MFGHGTISRLSLNCLQIETVLNPHVRFFQLEVMSKKREIINPVYLLCIIKEE
jgi:hypothetical protein